jgi:hypothetical protein
MENKSNPKICDVYGESMCWVCTCCNNVPLCVYSSRKWNGASCVFLYHRKDFFGLSMMDHIAVLRKGWKEGEKKTKNEIARELKN